MPFPSPSAVLLTGTALFALLAAPVAAQQRGTDRALQVLYDQTSNNSGLGTSSQNSGGSAYSAAADDFVVPKGSTWIVREVDVTGAYFNGTGAASESVTFYADRKGKVGDMVAQFDDVAGTDNSGSFNIALGKKGVKLKSGHYFVSVVANMSFDLGEWVWENQTTTEGDPAMWESPGSKCPTWAVERKCVNSPGDQMFVLKGMAR